MDNTKTLNQLESKYPINPEWDSYLVTTCHRLRDKPICEFSVEDLRIMIGQEISLNYLLPIALEVLNQNPLAEGDYYPGDLLKAVLNIETTFWHLNTIWAHRLDNILAKLQHVPSELVEAITTFRELRPN